MPKRRTASAREVRLLSLRWARSMILSSTSTSARARSGSSSSTRRIAASGMKRSSWSCLISRIRSTNAGG
jgi:hypothetical protein